MRLVQDPQGNWRDPQGTIINLPKDGAEHGDLGHCGLSPIETGDWDPFYRDGECPEHDADDDNVKAGIDKKGTLGSAADFSLGVAKTFARGLYAVTMAPAYLAIGGLGGILESIRLKLQK